MAQRILKNNTASLVPIADVGQSVPPSGQLVINPTDYGKYEGSSDVLGFISDLAVSPTVSTLTVNDGTFDLGISEGTRLIQGGFSRPISDGVDPTRKARVDLLKQLYVTGQIRGGTDDTVIGNVDDALKVAGILQFAGDTVEVEPGGDHLGFTRLQLCIQKAILEQLRIMNSHMAILTDAEDLEDEPNLQPDFT